MKNLFQIFEENLEIMQKLIGENNYDGCSSVSTDLITVSVMSDFPDGVLIGEVFEGVFDQVAPLFQAFDLNDEVQSMLKKQIGDQVALVGKSIKDENKATLYDALRNIRNIATQLQFKCYKTMKQKPESESTRTLRLRRRA